MIEHSVSEGGVYTVKHIENIKHSCVRVSGTSGDGTYTLMMRVADLPKEYSDWTRTNRQCWMVSSIILK
jgi:hypothetical protein